LPVSFPVQIIYRIVSYLLYGSQWPQRGYCDRRLHRGWTNFNSALGCVKTCTPLM